MSDDDFNLGDLLASHTDSIVSSLALRAVEGELAESRQENGQLRLLIRALVTVWELEGEALNHWVPTRDGSLRLNDSVLLTPEMADVLREVVR